MVVFVLLLCGCARRPASPPPSILLVTIDTLRADHVGCYGGAAATPNLDRIAAEGVRFDDARSQVPLTLPSHTTIMTGRYPPRHGVRGNGLFRLDPKVTTIGTALAARGYATAAVVSSVVLDQAYGLHSGFDVYDDDQRVGDRAAFNYLERGASQIVDSVSRVVPGLRPPFFLWVHLYDPHRPWVAPERFGHGYDAEIAFADAALGEIRRIASERAGGALVTIATSDHGESLGEHGERQHGYTLHRGVLHVPLVMAGPGVPKGKVVSGTVGLVDLAPTITEMAGAAPLNNPDGQSLVGSWNGGRGATHDALWEETLHPLYDSGWAPLRGLLTPEWHFVDAPRPELYARASDPGDTHDVATEQGDVVTGMRAELEKIASRLGDVPEPKPELGDDEESRELLEKLASLGYLASGAGKSVGARLDPKDGLPTFLAVEDAEELLDAGDAKAAYERVHPYSKPTSAGPRLWHTEAKALLALGRLRDAEDALSRALAVDSRSEYIRLTYVDVLRAKGDIAGARAELTRLARAHPRSADIALELASLAASQGDNAGAEAVLTASYNTGLRDPDILVALGRLLDLRGEHEAAAERFAAALTIRPSDPVAHYEIGRAALRAGDATRAIDSLRQCAEGPLAVECRIELARALVVGPRDLAGAREVLIRARELAGSGPLTKDVDVRLQALERMR